MRKFNAVDVMDVNTCGKYTCGEILKMWGTDGPDRTIAEICELDIPVDDRLWMACQLLPVEDVLSWAGEIVNTPDKGSGRLGNICRYWDDAKGAGAESIALAISASVVCIVKDVATRSAVEVMGKARIADMFANGQRSPEVNEGTVDCFIATWAKFRGDILSVMLRTLAEKCANHEVENG